MRYLPLSPDDRSEMLAKIGVDAIDDLFADVPADKLLTEPLDLPRRKGEMEVERILGRMAGRNVTASSVPFFVGAGAYKHHVPATVDHVIQRSEFLTSYTPYQPEIAQGTLQYLFEFQTQVAALTGMDVANASMYDGSTAAGEAVLMAHRVTRRDKAVLSGGLHPHYADVIETLSHMSGDRVVSLPADPRADEDIIAAIDDETSCVVVQTPDVFGNLRDLEKIAEKAHAHGALLIAAFTEVMSLGLIKPPGAMGADIVVGEGQSIGNSLNFGGPYVGLFAARQKFVRQMPGRLCGETVDAEGKRGFVLTLSTREQHIRRDKATSNICTNSGLCCLAFTIHMTLLGQTGLQRLARVNHANAVALADALAGIPGVAVITGAFFNEFNAEAAERRGGRGRGAGRQGCSGRRALFPPRPGCRLRRPAAGRLHRGQYRRGPRGIRGGSERRCWGDRRDRYSANHDHSFLHPRRHIMLNRQGRPTSAGDGAITADTGTFTGNRALLQEEALIFESGRYETTGVDFDETENFSPASGRARPRRRYRPAGALGARDDAPFRAPVAEELRHRYRALPAGLLHHEAQCPAERAHGATPRLRRRASAAAGLERAGRTGRDGRTLALSRHAHRHDQRGALAQGRCAWRIVRQ